MPNKEPSHSIIIIPKYFLQRLAFGQPELYWVTYNSSYAPTTQPVPWGITTMSIATASGFTPVTPPAYIASNHPNVYLSTTTGSSTTFTYNNPPYIYTTDPGSIVSGGDWFV
jgi:hypothetical protein